eukprot:g6439.t1
MSSSSPSPSSAPEDAARCSTYRDGALQCTTVKFILERMAQAGCTLPPENVVCEPCDAMIMGGWKKDEQDDLPKVVLCQNRIPDKESARITVAHELIHAFDTCRANVDWGNANHIACTEIRAAALSGDCTFTRELNRGNFGVARQHRACVRRRAILSVGGAPHVSEKQAEIAVDRVFERCYSDTAPFDRMP